MSKQPNPGSPEFIVLSAYKRVADDIPDKGELYILFKGRLFRIRDGKPELESESLPEIGEETLINGGEVIAFKVTKKGKKSPLEIERIPDFFVKKDTFTVSNNNGNSIKLKHTIFFFGKKVSEFFGVSSGECAEQAVKMAKSGLTRGVRVLPGIKCVADIGLNPALKRMAENRYPISGKRKY